MIVPTAVISGSDEYHTPEGNSIVLCCKIENVSIDYVNNTYKHVLIYYIIQIVLCLAYYNTRLYRSIIRFNTELTL